MTVTGLTMTDWVEVENTSVKLQVRTLTGILPLLSEGSAREP